MTQKNFVELRNVTKRFGSNTVIDNINLTIPQGQMVTLLGPSGCGKTTILRLVAGLLTAYPRARAWFSFTLRDSEHLSDGTPLRDVVALLAGYPQVVALGINCIALENTTAALQHLHGLTVLPLVVYPNSGEHYDAVSKTWHHHGEHCAQLADYLPQWQAAGARLIGGCCRTTPADIAALKARS